MSSCYVELSTMKSNAQSGSTVSIPTVTIPSATIPANTPVQVTVTAPASQAKVSNTKYGKNMNILRQVIGGELRRRRLEQGRTLREVSAAAQVSLGYLSEVERGQKEPSSELLNSICQALETPLSQLLAAVAMEVARNEAVTKPINTAGISQKSVTVAA